MDAILLLDVLEHVEDDGALLEVSLKALINSGRLLITVPAHPFLFSEHDVFLKHYRRYTSRVLLQLAQRNGLAIEEHFSFYTSLFIARIVQLIFQKLTAGLR